MAQIIGNVGAPFRGNTVLGQGTYNTAPNPRSWVTVTGTAGEVVALSAFQTVPNPGEIDLVVQSSGSVSMRFSLSTPSLAANPDPDVRSSAVWTAAEAVAASVIGEVNNGFPFTAVEITFTEAASVVFYTR